MRKSIIVYVILAFSGYLFANNAPSQSSKAGTILDAMSKKYAAIPSFNASFTYSTDGLKDSYKGEVTVKNKKFRLKLAGQEIFNNGQTVSTFIKETNEVNVSNFDPAEEGINPAKIYTIYKKGYKYAFIEEQKAGTKVYEVVELTPEKVNSQIAKLRITVDKKDKSVKSWRITTKDGKKQSFKIDKFVALKGLSDTHFNFDKAKYPGVEVIDLR
ncbi:MAG: outer membrane lipoprotein carrier protein LolA [Bacteroidota bacterium]